MVKRQKRCSSEQLDDTTVPLSDSVKSLGVLLDCTLSLENFISQTIKSCYYQFCQISSVQKYLSTEATVKLVTSLILSHLDYCNSLLSFLPASSVQSLRRIQNCAARLILKPPRKTDHITPLFQFLHWLPIQQRIQYKINTLFYKCITGTALSYISVTIFNFTHPPILSTLLLILSASRFLAPDSPLLVPTPFLFSVHQHRMTFPSLSNRNLLWTHSGQI